VEDYASETFLTPVKQRYTSPVIFREKAREYLTPAKLLKTPTQIREEYALVKSFKTQIEEDRKIEKQRCELALRSDFNLLDAFRYPPISQEVCVQRS